MKNTIKITITENAVLAHALYEVLYEHYIEDAGEIVSHSGKTDCDISFLLKNPAVYCNLNFANSDVTESINSEWNELIIADGTVNWKAFIEDVLFYLSKYDPKYSYTDDSLTVYTNAGKVMILSQNYLSGITESPLDLLNKFSDTDYYDIGKTTVQTYETNKSRFEVRSDDSKEFFENVEYFDGGYIESVSESYKFSFEFNSVAYTSKEVIFYKLDIKKECQNKFIVIPDNITNITLVQKNTYTSDEAQYAYCKYLLTTKEGTSFVVATNYLMEE